MNDAKTSLLMKIDAFVSAFEYRVSEAVAQKVPLVISKFVRDNNFGLTEQQASAIASAYVAERPELFIKKGAYGGVCLKDIPP